MRDAGATPGRLQDPELEIEGGHEGRPHDHLVAVDLVGLLGPQVQAVVEPLADPPVGSRRDLQPHGRPGLAGSGAAGGL